VLRATDIGGAGRTAELPLGFAGTEALPADPTVQVEQAPDGRLAVTGSGFRSAEVSVQLCDSPEVDTTASCGPALDDAGEVLGGTPVGPDGSLAVTVGPPASASGGGVVVVVTELRTGLDRPPGRSALATLAPRS
jgi:hypothetical protein